MAAPWSATTDALCYVILGRHLMIQGHGKTEELTMKSREWRAASEKGSKGTVNGGDHLEREMWGR